MNESAPKVEAVSKPAIIRPQTPKETNINNSALLRRSNTGKRSVANLSAVATKPTIQTDLPTSMKAADPVDSAARPHTTKNKKYAHVQSKVRQQSITGKDTVRGIRTDETAETFDTQTTRPETARP